MAKETSANEGRNVAVTNKNTSGIAGDKSVEYIGNFYQLNNETVVEGKTDSYIVLGTDRPSSPSSGYGGEGSSRASAIDIVVGRVSNNFSIQNEISQESGIWLNPDFQNDSARIYLSQKSNIDEYLSLIHI